MTIGSTPARATTVSRTCRSIRLNDRAMPPTTRTQIPDSKTARTAISNHGGTISLVLPISQMPKSVRHTFSRMRGQYTALETAL